MRDILTALQSHIESGASTLCHIWKLTCKDGVSFGFTDHDEMLKIDDLYYHALSGMSGGDADSSLGFSIDNSHVQSVFSDDRITADDINAGRYDSAELVCSIVNWQEVSQRLELTRGQLGEITQSGDSFNAEWVGEGIKLDRSQGRVFSRICDASFGDHRCGLNATDFPDGTDCPRRFAACRDRFSNTKNFRGFPYLLAMTRSPLRRLRATFAMGVRDMKDACDGRDDTAPTGREGSVSLDRYTLSPPS